jgi:cell division protein FtsL
VSAFFAGLRDFGGRWFTPVALGVILLLAVGVFKAKADAAAARKRVAELEAQVASQRDEARGLAAEVQFLENPKRIEGLARRELGMAPATDDQKKKASEVLQPAEAPR